MIQKHSAPGSYLGFGACGPLILGSIVAIVRKQELCSPCPEPAGSSDQAPVQLIWMRELSARKKVFLGCFSSGWGSDVTELREHGVWGREEQDVK